MGEMGQIQWVKKAPRVLWFGCPTPTPKPCGLRCDAIEVLKEVHVRAYIFAENKIETDKTRSRIDYLKYLTISHPTWDSAFWHQLKMGRAVLVSSPLWPVWMTNQKDSLRWWCMMGVPPPDYLVMSVSFVSLHLFLYLVSAVPPHRSGVQHSQGSPGGQRQGVHLDHHPGHFPAGFVGHQCWMLCCDCTLWSWAVF